MAHTTSTTRIHIEQPTPQKLEALRISTWPIWTKEPSQFDWHYDEQEMCYFLEGQVIVKTKDGEVSLKKGDFVTFPKGLDCTWHVKQAVRKHYRFE
ncbi:MAG: cupin domain-containing protein [Candidatus Omnitrophica bacterium]|nr:cupin domain-containing protein [Candidatus Omnitrophota bacterium]